MQLFHILQYILDQIYQFLLIQQLNHHFQFHKLILNKYNHLQKKVFQYILNFLYHSLIRLLLIMRHQKYYREIVTLFILLCIIYYCYMLFIIICSILKLKVSIFLYNYFIKSHIKKLLRQNCVAIYVFFIHIIYISFGVQLISFNSDGVSFSLILIISLVLFNSIINVL